MICRVREENMIDIKNIKTKSANELAVVIGHAKAKLILEHYSKKQGPG